MMKVRNKKVINHISFCTLKAKKKKNLIAVFAIMLTAIMVTVLFTIGSAMNKSFQESTMRQVGGKSMAGIKYILPEDYEKISKDSAIKNPSYRILVGDVENKELLKVNTEINYAEEENAKSMFCYPTKGSMPKERLEIATSTNVLDALGLPYNLGETVTLTFSVDGKKVTEDFILSGYWEGDKVAMAQECFVSKIYCDEIAPTPETSYYQTDGIGYAGYWMMDFDYANSWDIEGKTVSLLERNGYDSNIVNFGINWAYTTSSVDAETIVLIISMLCIILISAYLIIYNIFELSVAGDIQSYGLLKTIGTTEKQLKRLVRRQAVILSLIGIPCGLLLGTFIGKGLFPFIMRTFEIERGMEFSVNPFVFAGAAIFSFFTVWISCGRACRMAARVSPVEAVRYTDASYKGKMKEKKTRKITAFSFGLANIRRNRKKVFVVVLSLSLSMILLNSVYALVQGFDFDAYVSQLLVGDALVADAAYLNRDIERDEKAITPDIQEDLKKIKGVEEIHNVYFEDTAIEMGDAIFKKVMQYMEETPMFAEAMWQEEVDWIKEDRMLSCEIYGMDQWGTEQLEVQKGKLNWEKFKTGNYILLNSCSVAGGEPAFCDVGEKLQLGFLDGKVKEYEIMAIAEVPYTLSSQRMATIGISVVLPEKEYLEHTKDKGAMLSVLLSDKKDSSIYEGIGNYTEYVQENLDCVTKETYRKEFDEFVNMYWVVGGALSFVLGLIGILNFTNSVVTEILERKREFAMMEAVGMTGIQMKSILAWEGIMHIVFSGILSIMIGGTVSSTIIENVMEGMWFFECHFTIMPIIVCIPVLALIACIIPIAAYKVMMRESVVERLR